MTTTSTDLLLECRQISKHFGGVTALQNVDFTLNASEVHGLVGSNGAGKSTLMKILAGVLSDHEGEILLRGSSVKLTTPSVAQQLGIAMVYQELSGIGQLSIAENLFLGRHPTKGPFHRIDWKLLYQQASEYLRELDIELDIRDRLDRHPLVVQQMVEIARGLHSGARILILDEPTSALSPPEIKRLFTLIRQLKDKGVSLIFISHFIEDVLEICDRVTILKDGALVKTSQTNEISKHEVIHAMLGHSLDEQEMGYETGQQLPPRTSAPPLLKVKSLSHSGLFQNVHLEVAPGECLGLYGFVGAGHQELIHALAGARTPHAGQILIDQEELTPGDVPSAIAKGMVLVAADRTQTLIRPFPVHENVTMSYLKRAVGSWFTKKKSSDSSLPLLKQVGCRPANPMLTAGSLSGGNQQKVVLAKWLYRPIKVLLLEEPTRGMDVGAKEEIMTMIAEMKRQGTAVILASTEPELLIAHADRILTFSRGKIVHEFQDEVVDKASLMHVAEGSLVASPESLDQ